MGGSSGGLINGSEKQGVSSNGNSTSSVLSPKNEPNANTEKVHTPINEGKHYNYGLIAGCEKRKG